MRSAGVTILRSLGVGVVIVNVCFFYGFHAILSVNYYGPRVKLVVRFMVYLECSAVLLDVCSE